MEYGIYVAITHLTCLQMAGGCGCVKLPWETLRSPGTGYPGGGVFLCCAFSLTFSVFVEFVSFM